MEQFLPWLDPIWVENLQVRLEHWFLVEVLTWTSLAQLGAVVVAASKPTAWWSNPRRPHENGSLPTVVA